LKGEEKGTDRWAFQNHWVPSTPLRLDLTDEKELARSMARNNEVVSLGDKAKTQSKGRAKPSGKKAKHRKDTRRQAFLAVR